MKYLDLAVQTIVFVVGIVILLFSWEDANWPMGILFAQIILGPWQMVSSFISIVAKTPLYHIKRLHLLLASVYLIALYAYTASDSGMIPRSETTFRLMLMVPAWALAIFYYILTWKWVFPSKKNGGNFLPNLSF